MIKATATESNKKPNLWNKNLPWQNLDLLVEYLKWNHIKKYVLNPCDLHAIKEGPLPSLKSSLP